MPELAAETKAAGHESNPEKFQAYAAKYQEAMNAALGPDDDPRELLRRYPPADNIGPGGGDVSDVKSAKQAPYTNCLTLAGTIANYSNGHPAGVGKGICSPNPMAVIVPAVNLNRLSGGWYVDSANSTIAYNTTVALAVTVSNNRCGRYYASAFVSFGAPPGISPPSETGADVTPVQTYCN